MSGSHKLYKSIFSLMGHSLKMPSSCSSNCSSNINKNILTLTMRNLSFCNGTRSLFSEANTMVVNPQLEEEYKKEIGEIHEEYKDREKRRNSIMGVVVSTMCQKSISVQYYHNRFYPKYHCILPVRRKVMAHDEEEKCHVGDLVRVVPSRPMSKMKRHNLLEIVKKAKRIGDSKTGRREKIQRIFPKK